MLTHSPSPSPAHSRWPISIVPWGNRGLKTVQSRTEFKHVSAFQCSSSSFLQIQCKTKQFLYPKFSSVQFSTASKIRHIVSTVQNSIDICFVLHWYYKIQISKSFDPRIVGWNAIFVLSIFAKRGYLLLCSPKFERLSIMGNRLVTEVSKINGCFKLKIRRNYEQNPVQYKTVNLVEWIYRAKQNKYWK